MPYILEQDRVQLSLDENRWAETAGELNYSFTMALGIYGPCVPTEIVIENFIEHYITINGLNYQTINDIMGALLCSVEELNRRRGFFDKDITLFMGQISHRFYTETAADYEDKKIKANGDLPVFGGF